jgi:hypothetical protein
MHKTRYVAVWSLLFTALFFIEYTPILPRMQIPYDLAGFHYPLDDYAFQALKQGRFPQWDPTIYCGLSFADNIQTGIYYPPMWLMFALKSGSARLSYRALEYLALAQVWLAFVLCYAWLHDRRKLHWLASLLGAGGYAFGGYAMNNLQHLGLLAGYAWLPLAFLSVDEADQKGEWRPLWKLALASAMCLLSGYPPIWVVFALCSGAYAFARPLAHGAGARLGLWTSAALACSVLFSAVALLPAMEAAGLKTNDLKYGWASGFQTLEYYLSFFIPNYFKFDLGATHATDAIRDYLYLGAIILTGLPLAFLRRKFRDLAPLLAVLFVSLLFLVNPGRLLGRLIEHTALGQVTIDWDFLAGVSAALAPMAALGLDYGLRRANGRVPAWSAIAGSTLALAWSMRLLVLWNGPAITGGLKSVWDAAGGIILCASLVYLYPRTRGALQSTVAAALILLAASDYKAFGTSKQFNGEPQRTFVSFTGTAFPGMNAATYAELQQHSRYRWAIEEFGPNPVDLRHVGVDTPQGFDPNLPAQYKKLIDQIGHFETNRTFDLNLDDPDALRLLGVGYVISAEQSPGFARLKENPNFRFMKPDDSYYKVFELADAQPPFGWEETGEGKGVDVIEWKPELRGLRIKSPEGGVFRLSEQFYPGWSAALDGAPLEIERCHDAFQCVAVAPGEHLLEFRYRSRWLLPGAAISLCSVLLAVAFVRFRRAAPLPDSRGSEETARSPAPVPTPGPFANPRGSETEVRSQAPAPAQTPILNRDRQGAAVRYALTKAPRIVAALLLAAFFWAFLGRALKSHFGSDEMMNIYGYWQPALWKVALASLTFWSSFVRPLGAVYYLPLFHLFKLNPVPYTWVRIGLLAVNTVVFYKLARAVSRSWWAAALATVPIAYQANLGYLSFDGAFVYDILCGGFYFAALLYYIQKRRGATHLSTGQACVFLALNICALDSKEMAVSLPVVALAYEMLFQKRGSGLSNLARQFWPTLTAGAITAVFILGKTLGAGTLTATEAYRPVLTWARFSESSVRFFNTIFYTDGLTLEHVVVMWGLLLCAGFAGLVRRRRDPRWMFLWVWVTVTPLPIAFLPGRGGAQLYIVAVGWALVTAMLLRALSWRLTRELFRGRAARLAAMGLFLLGSAAAYASQTRVVHRDVVYGYLLTGKRMAEVIGQFEKLGLHPRPGSRIVFLHDPFDGTFNMTFVAALVWDDRSLRIFQQSQAHLPEDQVAGMDYIVDYRDDKFVVLKQN